MIQLGMKQKLVIKRMKDFGAYVGEAGNDELSVLLPKKQLPEGAGIGDEVEVFIYKDSEDRLIATTNMPKICLGQVEKLRVAQVGNIGAFLEWGLEKDLFLPFKEQTHRVRTGEECLVALYVDKSRRLAATMNVYDYLRDDAPYKKDDRVTGTIYEINEEIGAFVAVDNRYNGLIPAKELFGDFRVGSEIEARVTQVREDGKLNLSARDKAYVQIEKDAEEILKVLEEFEGRLPFTDKASPEVIKREFNLSKNAFKRAIGHLLKAGKIRINEKSIERL